jgi:hypothetical protein
MLVTSRYLLDLMTLGYLQHRQDCLCVAPETTSFDCTCGLLQIVFAAGHGE